MKVKGVAETIPRQEDIQKPSLQVVPAKRKQHAEETEQPVAKRLKTVLNVHKVVNVCCQYCRKKKLGDTGHNI